MAPRDYTRRRVAAVLGTGLMSGLTGCFDVLSDPSTEPTEEPQGTNETTTTTTEATTQTTTTRGTTTTEPTTVETTTPDETTTAPTTTTVEETTTTTTTTTEGRPVRTDDPYATNQAGKAAVRVAHMAPDAPKVDIAVDGTTVVTELAFGNVSPYFVLEPGTHHVAVSPSGLPTTVFSEDLEVEAQTYTVVAFGEVASSNHPLEFKQFGDLVDPLSPQRTRIRLVHAVPDAERLDVTLANRNETLFDDVAYGTPSSYAHPRAGAYTLEVRRATRADDGEVLGSFDVDLPGGAVLTAFAKGYLSPEDAPTDAEFGLRVVIDASG